MKERGYTNTCTYGSRDRYARLVHIERADRVSSETPFQKTDFSDTQNMGS